ncbi:glycerol 3-phosphate dehydrogenase (NAD(P)+) [Streptomyces sp. OV198]|jgi:glycerol-3-phosphate dehydrogenase (NAD(P)+)|uniref:NAD(P)H-dependent glycerol-3-phosphate dehydrogenase n=1 Tax=unclassified Streptomyces TaxID=2593676 RepID=UPI000BB13CE1|nr:MULTISPECIES: NAD(P)H-dependent glycerol-3-phosphate dehydrogenase [unclassified Streptomyces]PBC93579.1 glycerol 3-phosphate dehydrogenase (NAD(P)+) [Streptomyces sp. Ag82_O1-15]SOE46372.1 glycerol 3-phosphate dehydrogenase (NAD(P)+) [Streptomyces sp. OV198]
MNRVAVLSAGSWGTTFALVVADAGNDVVLHARRREVVDSINTRHENPAYLPGIALPASLRATADISEALDGADYVVVSIPAQTFRANLTAWAPLIGERTVVVSLMKGIETRSGLRMTEVITEVTRVPSERVAVVSGPNLAREIAARQPAASVIACRDETTAKALQEACLTPYFRPYTNTDVVGCELGGALKNVIALAVGLAAGMGLGDNARPLLITRGLAETARLGTVLGADPLSFSGLAGVGDLIATCMSPLSRNRTFGEHLGRGMTVDEAATATGQTAEGVKSSQSILELARRHGVDMPITEVVVDVIRGAATVAEAASMLMNRSPKPELYGTC